MPKEVTGIIVMGKKEIVDDKDVWLLLNVKFCVSARDWRRQFMHVQCESEKSFTIATINSLNQVASLFFAERFHCWNCLIEL